MRRWKLVLALTAVFLAGLVAGGLAIMRLIPPFGRVPDAPAMTFRLMHRLKSDLALTPDQEAKIQPVLARATEQTIATQRQFMARIQNSIDASDLEIEAFLDPKQKARFESIRAKRPHLPGPP